MAARRLFAACLVLFLSVAAADSGSGVVLVLGDSLSAAYGIDVDKGWVRLLERRLQRYNFAYEVVNASISGETTRGAAERIDRALSEHRPDIVVVELGGNDGLRGLDLDTTRKNLQRIVDACLAAGAEVLLLAMELPPNYGQSYVEAFRKIYKRIAEKEGVHLVPFFLDGVAGDGAMMQADGIHPRAEAQPRMLDNVWPHLEPLLDG